MTMDQFIAKYGYRTAGFLIRELAQRARLHEREEDVRKECLSLATDLDEALKSLEGKKV